MIPAARRSFGITCFDLAEERHLKMDSMMRWAPIVKAMPLSEADTIYDTKYATACAFNALNVGKDCVVFDTGVNSGPSRSIKIAQVVVRVHVDGILGPITLAAINNWEPRAFINGHCDFRLQFLRGLGTWGVFGAGWEARVLDLRTYSLNLAFPLAKATPMGYAEKLERIPLAYAKAYHPDDLPVVQ